MWKRLSRSALRRKKNRPAASGESLLYYYYYYYLFVSINFFIASKLSLLM